jgi:SAM-dependent methyltransferase
VADLVQPATAAALARYYDLDLDDDPGDLDMYLAFAEAADGSILELMAGSGRLAVPLAAAGHRVTAVDRDAAMLARADALWRRTQDRAESGALDLVEADVTTLALKERFDLVIVALNSLLLLDGRGAQHKLFEVVAQHLSPDGRAVIDFWLPTPDDLRIYDGRLILDWVRTDAEMGEHVSKSTAARYSSGDRTARITTLFDAWRDGAAPVRTLREDTITFTTADELMRFAEDAGLAVETIGGDYEMGQFDGDSDRVVMVCRAATR